MHRVEMELYTVGSNANPLFHCRGIVLFCPLSLKSFAIWPVIESPRLPQTTWGRGLG